MRRGAWHQFGDRSQRLVLEQLAAGHGVGVIVSARDLAIHKAEEYCPQYKEVGVEILLDLQFYVPQFVNPHLSSYNLDEFRTAVSQLHAISDADLDRLSSEVEAIQRRLGTNAVVAPALAYEAGRPDLVELNARLFQAAKRAGDALGIPTHGTLIVSRSGAATDDTLTSILSAATASNSDGWYYGVEFQPERIPSSLEHVLRCCSGGLTLASSGKPILHAYAGPMALLSFGFGATGAAIGHSQNVWKFTPDRWAPADGGGGGGDAPARFFSAALWGTIVVPDEVLQLTAPERTLVLTGSNFSQTVLANPALPWPRWQANKHLVAIICSVAEELASLGNARAAANAAVHRLTNAVHLHQQIRSHGIILADATAAYQANWRTALDMLLTDRSADYDFLELLEP